MKKSILLVIFFVMVFSNIKPISEKSAKWVGLGVGAGAGLVGGSLMYRNFTHYNSGCKIPGEPTEQTKFFSIVTGLGISGLAGYLAYKIAMYNTPKAKFSRAIDIINRTLVEDLVAKKFRKADLFVKYSLGRFASNWPLVDARQRLEKIRMDLIEARSLLSAACFEIKEDDTYLYMCNKAKEYNEIIDDFLGRIIDRMSILISNSLYRTQVKQYAKYQKELRKHKEKMSDRWHKHKEKERDRELLQNLTEHRPNNIGFNFNMS